MAGMGPAGQLSPAEFQQQQQQQQHLMMQQQFLMHQHLIHQQQVNPNPHNLLRTPIQYASISGLISRLGCGAPV